ncbi:hypothetical protein SH611_17890 [Geminicoccaceae bacterium 1502E]|nr:hypothetical protein [Geminicoccaceae bacterium 1502E]
MRWFRFRWPQHVDTGPVTSYVREKMGEASWSDPAQRDYIRILRQIEELHGGPFPGGLGRMA